MDLQQIVDSHIHLHDYEPGTDIREIVRAAAEAGVTRLVCNGTSEESWKEIVEFAESNTQVVPCFGIHPWFIERCSEGWESRLDGLIERMRCGVGEIGLDRLREPCDRTAQESAFRTQLRIARKHDRPAMIHCVRAWGWMMDVLMSELRLPSGFLMHSYGGSADLVKPLAQMGAYFSFSGKVLSGNFERARLAIRAVPMDRLLVETDAPCMIPPEEFRPHPLRSSTGDEYNHPANLPSIVAGIAAFLEVPAEDLREILLENSRTFFGRITTF
jgi:TatD DNase family protein